MRLGLRLLAVAFMLSVISCTIMAQELPFPDTSASKGSRISVAVTAGYVSPRSKDGLTQFWKGGPGFAVSLLLRAAPGFWVGTGLDVSALWFKQSSFALAYPNVEMQKVNMAWTNLFLLARYGFLPGASVHPYAEVDLGASRLSGAEYKEVIDSVRVTYYEIPARTRLALTLTAGVDIPVSGGLSFLAEGFMRYVHHDENIGIGLGVRGGVRVIL